MNERTTLARCRQQLQLVEQDVKGLKQTMQRFERLLDKADKHDGLSDADNVELVGLENFMHSQLYRLRGGR